MFRRVPWSCVHTSCVVGEFTLREADPVSMAVLWARGLLARVPIVVEVTNTDTRLSVANASVGAFHHGMYIIRADYVGRNPCRTPNKQKMKIQ
jgi:hypothetical protein